MQHFQGVIHPAVAPPTDADAAAHDNSTSKAARVRAETGGGGSARNTKGPGAAKGRKEGSPRRRTRSRSLSGARAGAEMMKPPSTSCAAPRGSETPASPAAAAFVVHGGNGGRKEQERTESSRSAHPVKFKTKIKRAASGNLFLKIAAGSATVGVVRVGVAIVAALLRGKAQEREAHDSKAAAVDGDAVVGGEGHGNGRLAGDRPESFRLERPARPVKAGPGATEAPVSG